MVQFMEFRIFEFSKLRIVAFFLTDFSLFDIERVAARFLWSWSIVALVSLYPCLVISTYGIQSFICVAHILSWLQIQSMWAFVLNNVHDEVIQNRFYCQWKFCWCCCYASAENGVLNIGSGSREGSPPLARAQKVMGKSHKSTALISRLECEFFLILLWDIHFVIRRWNRSVRHFLGRLL